MLISEILAPESFALDVEELQRISDSIRAHGLFHPIIVQGDGAPYKIIAGRIRYLSFVALGKVEIPATILPSSVPNPHEISLHENLRRHNLPWYDQVELEKELHELRISQHGRKADGRPAANASGWSQNDTARELGLALGTFSQDMALATELARNPQLRNVKDKTTALKIIKNITKRQTAEIEQSLYSEDVNDDILLGDSEFILKTFKDGIFDLCITDPPWSEYRDETLRAPQEKLLPIFLELSRVMKRDSIALIITSSTDFYFYSRELPKIGFQVQSYPIIWHKPKTITHGRAAWQFARDYEPILVAAKGNPSLTTGIEVSSILEFDNVHPTKMIHPHEKPVDLIKKLINLCSHSGAKVIDPFAGSGATLEACKLTDRRFIGIEKDRKFHEAIVRRLNES